VKRKCQYIALIVCIFGVGAWIFLKNFERHTVLFPIRQVRVEGVYWLVPQPSLEKMITPYLHPGYFFVNLFSLRHALQKLNPWIESVAISRQWPDKIVVVLQQKVALATFNQNQLITTAGEIFSPPIDSFPPDLPKLFGPREQAQEILKNYQIFTSMADSVNLVVLRVTLLKQGYWHVELNNKIVVMLGENDILDKFKRFCTVYQQVFVPQHREPSYVDMRYSHGMAVNWKN
jgi:cell division protein FtsQ